MKISEFLSTTLFNLSILSYQNIMVILLTVIITLLIRLIITKILFSMIHKLTSKSKTELDDLIISAVKRPLGWIITAFGLIIGYSLLDIPSPDMSLLTAAEQTEKLTAHKENLVFVGNVLASFSTAFITWLLYALTENISAFFLKKAKATETKMDDAVIPFIRRSVKVLIISVCSLLVLQNLGFDVAGLVAGLGIGGLAVALAAKDAIGNVFGSATIFIDKAFQISDWIKVGDVEGIVEDIGLRSTRIRKFSKTLLIIPNEKIASSTIENFSQRPYRRICETFKVVLGTTPDQMRRILVGIRQLIEDDPEIKNDYYLVNFNGITETGLEIFIYCFCNSADWKYYLDVRENFMLKIMELIKKEGSDVARPVYTINKV